MKTDITAILVDDEIDALTILELKLQKHFPHISIIGKFDDPLQAIQNINALQPQLVFLDINMPEYTGFELLREIYHPSFELIFVTAYDNYAIEAIKHAAVGYVLKPIHDAELTQAVLKAINHLHVKSGPPATSTLIKEEPKIQKISIPFNNGFALKSIKDILRFEGFGGYTKIYMNNGQKEVITSSYNIGLFNKMLVANNFRMVHKSHLINLDYVDKYLNEGVIILTNGDQVPVSRANKNEILQILRNIG